MFYSLIKFKTGNRIPKQMEIAMHEIRSFRNTTSRYTISILLCALSILPSQTLAWTAKPVKDDPLVRMPGTQPGQVLDLESDKQCLSCHGGFEMDHWKGSLMAQAGRDPLFWAGLTVAAQDAIWALGTPNAADICVKCHFP